MYNISHTYIRTYIRIENGRIHIRTYVNVCLVHKPMYVCMYVYWCNMLKKLFNYHHSHCTGEVLYIYPSHTLWFAIVCINGNIIYSMLYILIESIHIYIRIYTFLLTTYLVMHLNCIRFNNQRNKLDWL